MKSRKSSWNWPKNKAFERYEASKLSAAELDARALKRMRGRAHPNSGMFMRRRLGAVLGSAVLLPAAVLGISSIDNDAAASDPLCIGKQTLTTPEGGIGPIDLVERNVGGDADPRSVTIDIQTVGREPVKAALAGSSIPGGASVDVPVTCVQEG